MAYPILEYDPARRAFIEPSEVVARRDVPESCVICFFKEVVERVATEHEATVVVRNHWEDGPHDIFSIIHRECRLAFFHPGVGAPLASGLLEEAIGYGCRKFVACGGCGILEGDIAVGRLIVVSAAVRDEGVSYHYLPAAREVVANPDALAAVVRSLDDRNTPYLVGKTWTTDAPYRETIRKIKSRQEEGCVAVDMEAAGLMAVAQFRGVPYGQILYAGDDLSGAEWDKRNWQYRSDIRERLFWLAADAVLSL